MKLPAKKVLAAFVCVSSVWGASAAPAEAFFFPCCWGGCGGGGYGCGYRAYDAPAPFGRCGPGGCGVSSYYAPVYGAPCGSACSPCGVACAPCGGAACASGSCAPSANSTSPTPDPLWETKKQPETFAPDAGATPPSGGPDDRNDSDADFQRSERSGAGRQSYKVQRPSGGAPGADSQLGDPVPVTPRGSSFHLPAVPNVSREQEFRSPELPTINLDDKIAWRAAPERKRLTKEAPIRNARLVRRPTYPAGDWLPVEPESKVARK
ncbi:MAG: hypothetical protein ACT4QC_07700 [Planctomycetaceae bacterium]